MLQSKSLFRLLVIIAILCILNERVESRQDHVHKLTLPSKKSTEAKEQGGEEARSSATMGHHTHHGGEKHECGVNSVKELLKIQESKKLQQTNEKNEKNVVENEKNVNENEKNVVVENNNPNELISQRAEATVCDWLTLSSCYQPAEKAKYASGLAVPTEFRVAFHVPRLANGTRALVTQEALAYEAQQLIDVLFSHFNAVPDFLVHYVDDDLLRNALVDPSDSLSVGDGKCNPDNNYPELSFDGGDCDYCTTHRYEEWGCAPRDIGNRVCNPECNFAYFDYDNGDCCLGPIGTPTCIDPSSEKTTLMTGIEWKTAMIGNNFAPEDSLNIFFTPGFISRRLGGYSSFPFADYALSATGGLVVLGQTRGGRKVIGAPNDYLIPHEVGHAFGLFHTFDGVSEWGCFDACAELVSTPDRRVVGDMCADTPPLPVYGECVQNEFPLPPQEDCLGDAFVGWPDHNIMSYTDCSNTFSPEQFQIMSCHLESLLQSWKGNWNGILSSTVPNTWTCNAANYASHDGCHCSCGTYDPDCNDSSLPDGSTPIIYGCENLANAVCSSQGQCTFSQVVPEKWNCSLESYNSSDGCDCNCGLPDPDCNVTPFPVTGCSVDPFDHALCDSNGDCIVNDVPPTWRCPPEFYNSNDGCDCNCGYIDPDCERSGTQQIHNCVDDYTCNPYANCDREEPPSTWQCTTGYYHAFDGCDCGCGAPDPDCYNDVDKYLQWNCYHGDFCINDGCYSPTTTPSLPLSRIHGDCILRSGNISYICIREDNGFYDFYSCDSTTFPTYSMAIIGSHDFGYTLYDPASNSPLGPCDVRPVFDKNSNVLQVSMKCEVVFEGKTCSFQYSAASSLQISFFSLIFFLSFIKLFF